LNQIARIYTAVELNNNLIFTAAATKLCEINHMKPLWFVSIHLQWLTPWIQNTILKTYLRPHICLAYTSIEVSPISTPSLLLYLRQKKNNIATSSKYHKNNKKCKM